ncbi:MAG: hypothetical protein K2Y39_01615 [Candidatus Obscuribacterales bacterium]|nr:hypothetical protein [Candidatus Obscuribacterales bacterium]
MNGIHAQYSPKFSNDSEIALSLKVRAGRLSQTVDLKRVLNATYLFCSGVLLVMAIDIHITLLTICFAVCGYWASNRLSSNSCRMVTPVLVLLNLIVWREMYLALPFAALTLALAQRFAIKDSWRNLLRTSGILGASLSILYVFGNGILSSVGIF